MATLKELKNLVVLAVEQKEETEKKLLNRLLHLTSAFSNLDREISSWLDPIKEDPDRDTPLVSVSSETVSCTLTGGKKILQFSAKKICIQLGCMDPIILKPETSSELGRPHRVEISGLAGTLQLSFGSSWVVERPIESTYGFDESKYEKYGDWSEQLLVDLLAEKVTASLR